MILPEFHGNLSDDDELRREFLVGARAYGFELVDLDDLDLLRSMKAESPPRFAIQPQQLFMVDALNAAGYDEYVVEAMRRVSKTTTIFMWLLGRLLCRPGYYVTFSAQNGKKGSARLREWKNRLDKTSPDPEAGIPPWRRGLATKPARVQRHTALFGADDVFDTLEEPSKRGFRIMMGEVGKGIYFDNGAQLLVFKPDADDYRGEAGDVSWVDEFQEVDPEDGADLLAGIIPLQDTRDEAALIVSGTAGEVRVGPFWERVERIRKGDPDIGGVDYCAPEETPWEIVEDEESAMQLLKRIHPGIGTLTTETKMRKNWRKMDKPKWAREYLSLWPETFGVRAVPAEKWADAVASRRPPKPARVAFGLAIKPGGGVAAIAAAWRNARGEAYVEIIEHRSGTDWLPERCAELTTTYRGSTIAYDDIGEGKATATEMLALPRRPKLRMQTYRETASGCVQILRDLERGKLRHFDDVGLNAAVARAAKRETRNDNGVWLWTPAEKGEDITCLDAATRALRNWDQHYTRRPSGSTSIMAA
ncbi:hypothetical protein [Agromyces laixinhei]|uniref:hypothetical protein n=1 Tax=Agromyces laixinhei TaxID=2585717 RepID=UPI0012ECBFB6|nr:hypothetical protein [Agromyces laixinhei]